MSSPKSIDLNEDHKYMFFSTNHQASSLSSSLSTSILFNPDQDQGGSCYWESKHFQSEEEAQKIVYNGSWDHPVEKIENRSDLRVWKREEDCHNLKGEDSSTKWMSSKMMVSDQTGSDVADNSNSKQIKYKEKNPPLSPQVTDDSNSSSNQNSVTDRVCSDCYTTKTPLWRTGPKGPKSLCNACGIRLRKARRAIAAAAATTSIRGNRVEGEKSEMKKKNNLHSKGTKSKTEGAAVPVKKKRELAKHRKKIGAFEKLTVGLSKNLEGQQDEKEAAILLMALSHGLHDGFPSDRYIS